MLHFGSALGYKAYKNTENELTYTFFCLQYKCQVLTT